MEPQKFECKIGGRKLIISCGELAGQANGAVSVQYGETVVLATVVLSKNIREGINWLPLLVDYEERLYAAGKIKGSRWIKREGRPGEEAVLTARLVDRSLRPLFDKRIRNDIQVVITVLSVDGENDSDLISLLAASAALTISDIPFSGPIGGVRLGRIGQEWVLNPTYKAREKSSLDLVLASREGKVVMIEAEGKETKEKLFLEALQYGLKHSERVRHFIQEIQEKVGRPKIVLEDEDGEKKRKQEKLKEKVSKFLKGKIQRYFEAKDRTERLKATEELRAQLDEELKADSEISKEERGEGLLILDEMIGQEIRRVILKEEKRVDDRHLDEIRPLSCKIALLPRTHGSALFTRGDTQVLSIVTLGAPDEEQFLETVEGDTKKRFMHHYNFPPFSVGEAAPLKFPSRREIGHGLLVEKALWPILPSQDDFPYTIRVVSEILSSNGSTSQASASAVSLALMDAGVPIKKAVAGIAMGLVTKIKVTEGHPGATSHLSEERYGGSDRISLIEEIEDYKILTDIQGREDSDGDMDMKVAGTREGITAIQMDTKLKGINSEIIKRALEGAKKARLEILEIMNEVISQSRSTLSPYAPRVKVLEINPEKIRDVVGPGGRVINEIINETGVTIDIEPDGKVFVTSKSDEALEKACSWIKNLTREVKVGEIFQGKVIRLVDFGAFVEILPKQEGLLHISEMAPYRIRRVEDVVRLGDIIPVKVINIDEQGRISLSLRQVQRYNSSPNSSQHVQKSRSPKTEKTFPS